MQVFIIRMNQGFIPLSPIFGLPPFLMARSLCEKRFVYSFRGYCMRHFLSRGSVRFFSIIAIISLHALSSGAQTRYMGEGFFESAMDKYVQGLYDEAIPIYERFIEIAPNDFQGHYFLARCHGFTGNTGKARTYYEKALAILPENYDAHLNYGVLLL